MEDFDIMQMLQGQGQQQPFSPLLNPNQPLVPVSEASIKKAVKKVQTMQPEDPAAPIMGMLSPPKSSYSQALTDLLSSNVQGLQQQREGIGQLEGEFKNLKTQPQVDPLIATLFGASDIVNETNFTNTLLGQKADAQKRQEAMAEKIQKAKGDLSGREIDLLKAQAGFAEGQQKDEQQKKYQDEMLKLNWAKVNADKNKDQNPDLKDTQVNAAGFGRRLVQAEEVFKDLENSGYDRTGRMEDISNRFLPGELHGENLKRQSQAERNFVNSILRRESGAAISADEFKNAEQQYFPRPGDTPEVISQKRANRLQQQEMLKLGAGPAWERLPQISSEVGVGKKPMSFEEWKKAKGK